MRRVLIIFVVVLLQISTVLANQEIKAKNPHQIDCGLDFFTLQLNNSIAKGTQSTVGVRLGYEYFTPKTLYFGIDILGACLGADFEPQYTRFRSSVDLLNIYFYTPPSETKTKYFYNIDARAGYTFSLPKTILAPYLGIGYYAISPLRKNSCEGFSESLPYVAAGVCSEYDLASSCTLRCNLKLLHTFCAKQEFNYGIQSTTSICWTEFIIDNNSAWGGEVSLALLWHPDLAKRWSIELEPYFTSLDFSETQNIYGARLEAGYCF